MEYLFEYICFDISYFCVYSIDTSQLIILIIRYILLLYIYEGKSVTIYVTTLINNYFLITM